VEIFFGIKGTSLFPNAIIPFTTERNDRIHLSGFWNYKGLTSLIPQITDNPQATINFEGGRSSVMYFSIINMIKDFGFMLQYLNPQMLDIFLKTVNIFENCYFNKLETNESLENKFLNGENLFFLSGSLEHLV